MMFKSHYGETVTVVLSLVMGLIMAVAAIFVDHLPFHFGNLFSIWGMIVLVILIVSIIIPYKAWSEKLTGLVCTKRDGIAWKLVENILPSLILNTCNTVIVSAANILFNEAIPAQLRMGEWTQGIIHDWPITFVISYLAAFVAEAAGKWVADRYAQAPEKPSAVR